MTIYKSKSLIEVYRAKASSGNINELTGRTGRPDLTRFVIDEIIPKLPLKAETILVDIGCGDGLLLQKASHAGLDSYRGRLIGVLPTVEEVTRVRVHLVSGASALIGNPPLISIELGQAEKTSMPDHFCDVLVCNGVLHGSGQTIEDVTLALKEFRRITKIGATFFVGEMPDADAFSGKNYGNSITAWLFWVLKNQGFSSFSTRLKQVFFALVSSEPFVIAPKNMFFMCPEEFSNLLNQYGFKVVEYYRHREIDGKGNVFETTTRWNYIAVRF